MKSEPQKQASYPIIICSGVGLLHSQAGSIVSWAIVWAILVRKLNIFYCQSGPVSQMTDNQQVTSQGNLPHTLSWGVLKSKMGLISTFGLKIATFG